MSSSELEVQVKLAEYQAAQEMLKHYDALNWQIGSVLIGANAILLGLIASNNIVQLFDGLPWNFMAGLVFAVAVAGFSRLLLKAWQTWFERHAGFYNLRNETLQRLELELGMYHFLRVVEAMADNGVEPAVRALPRLTRAKERAGYDRFEPIFKVDVPKISGESVGKKLACWVPVLEGAVLVVLIVAVNL